MSESSEISQLKEQYAGLEQQTRTLLYGLLVASLTLTAFLGVQARRTGNELDAIRPQAAQVAEQTKREEVGLHAFLGQLLDYGKAHPEYGQIVEKYKIVTVKNPAATGAAPATATAPAPKK